MIRHGFAEANELKLHYAASGPVDGHLLLFLHGFPEYWRTWERQLLDLGDRYHCVAPDLPGYNLSSKPADVPQYRTKRLIDDVVAFAGQFSRKKKFTLIAHDWGGALAWAFAIKRPELIERLVIINAVHPGAFQREIAKNPAQAAASQYIHELRAADAEVRYAANGYALRRWAGGSPAIAPTTSNITASPSSRKTPTSRCRSRSQSRVNRSGAKSYAI